ncbi:MAG: hypothetical protein KIT18_15775, partial [Burkholderiales bacterium]|nr:hypothetical protein [Burkholderiales bacterium]
MTDIIEKISRTLCEVDGRDPDGEDIMLICDAENRPLPLWRLYIEPAEAVYRLMKDEIATTDAVARWMIRRGIPTGHGDTLSDLMREIEDYWRYPLGQIAATAHRAKWEFDAPATKHAFDALDQIGEIARKAWDRGRTT